MSTQKPIILLVAPYGFNDRLTNYIEFVTGRLLAKNGWRVLALARHERDEAETEVVEGIEVTRYLDVRRGAIRLIRLFLHNRPGIVHVHTLRNNQIGFLAALLARTFHVPLFFTEYGLPHDHYLSCDRDDPFSAPLAYDNVISSVLKLLKRSLRDPLHLMGHIRNYFFHYPLFAAQTVVFVSKHNLPIAQKLGIKDARYLPYTTDDLRWNISQPYNDTKLLKEVQMLPRGKKVLFVGQLKERKGWEIYLRAIPQVPKECVSAFIIVTPSMDTSEYHLLVAKLDLKERVVLFERIPSTVLKALYATSDIVVVPSLYEGFGLVPFEAFDAGKPVIASRVEALTDFLEHEKNALLIPPNDPDALAVAIERCAKDDALAQTLVAGGNATIAEMRSVLRQAQWCDFYRTFVRKAS